MVEFFGKLEKYFEGRVQFSRVGHPPTRPFKSICRGGWCDTLLKISFYGRVRGWSGPGNTFLGAGNDAPLQTAILAAKSRASAASVSKNADLPTPTNGLCSSVASSHP